MRNDAQQAIIVNLTDCLDNLLYALLLWNKVA